VTELINVSVEGNVGVIQLNRPKQLNALNTAIAAEVITAAKAFDESDDIACIVLTGSEKAFAAGADISEMCDMSADQMNEAQYFAEWQEFVDVSIPKIAAVNGYALGGGCELMMMCDFAIAGENAKFGQPEITLGVIPGIGGSQRMTRLIGRSLSMDMHLTGRIMGAAEALRSGLIARVVADDKVMEEAMTAATKIASYSKPALRATRQMLMYVDENPLADGIKHERQLFYSLFGTEDQKEGMNAFLQKRKPEFKTS